MNSFEVLGHVFFFQKTAFEIKSTTILLHYLVFIFRFIWSSHTLNNKSHDILNIPLQYINSYIEWKWKYWNCLIRHYDNIFENEICESAKTNYIRKLIHVNYHFERTSITIGFSQNTNIIPHLKSNLFLNIEEHKMIISSIQLIQLQIFDWVKKILSVYVFLYSLREWNIIF